MLAAAGTLFARRARFLWRLVRAAKPTERFDDIPGRVENEVTIVLGQKKLFQRLLPGVMHALIFWGFLVLFPTIVMALVGAVNRDWSIPWLGAQG
ncbi:MAG: Fe-S oxidoreductase, partial [Gaiellaceae bacterium]